MKRLSLFSLLAIASVSALTGCATTQPVRDDSLASDPAYQTIQEAVGAIEKQNAMLVQIEQAKTKIPEPSAKPTDPAFAQLVYLRNWNGDAYKALEAVASDMGYTANTSGVCPAITPTVSIDANGVEAYQVLENIADQGQRHYDIRVDVKTKTITMAYRKEG